jgi:hypothetical protein
MPVAFRTTRITFDQTKGFQNEPATVVFKTKVRSAGLAINGYKIQFDDGDHHLQSLEINILDSKMKLEGTTVSFSVDFAMRDNDLGFTHPFDGYVDVLVIADVE